MYQSLGGIINKNVLRKTNSPTNPRLSREVNFILKDDFITFILDSCFQKCNLVLLRALTSEI